VGLGQRQDEGGRGQGPWLMPRISIQRGPAPQAEHYYATRYVLAGVSSLSLIAGGHLACR
jgi:hypothetical protein